MLHCSLPETKSDNKLGHGTYFTVSNLLSEKMKIFVCEAGKLLYLDGNNSLAFYKQIQLYDEISKLKREHILSLLFPKNEILSNENHFTFLDMNTVLLGCNSPNRNDLMLPLTTGPYENAYIVKPNLPFEYDDRTHYYIVPHGTGNKIREFDKLEYIEDKGLFVMRQGEIIFYCKELSHIVKGNNSIEQIQNEDFAKFCVIKELLYPRYQFKF